MNAVNVKAAPVVEHMVRLDTYIFGTGGDLFILRADGDGMRNAGINTGDWLIFDASRTPESGDIVLLTLIGNPLCRRVFFEGDTLRVRREDGVTPDILTNEPECYEISAVLIGSMRNYKQKKEAKREEDGISVAKRS